VVLVLLFASKLRYLRSAEKQSNISGFRGEQERQKSKLHNNYNDVTHEYPFGSSYTYSKRMSKNFLSFIIISNCRRIILLLEHIVRESTVESIRNMTVKVQSGDWTLIHFLRIQNDKLSQVITSIIELCHNPSIIFVNVALSRIMLQRIYTRNKNWLADNSEFFASTPYLYIVIRYDITCCHIWITDGHVLVCVASNDRT
jgi:hypothetical protein